jgi:hypothetical protein
MTAASPNRNAHGSVQPTGAPEMLRMGTWLQTIHELRPVAHPCYVESPNCTSVCLLIMRGR